MSARAERAVSVFGAAALVAAAFADPAPPRTLRAAYGLAAPATFEASRTALVLVDFQDEFFHGELRLPRGEGAVRRAAALLRWARESRVTVVHVRNEAPRADAKLFAKGSPATAFVPELAPGPGELTVTKTMGGAFSKTELETTLRTRGVETLVIAGLMTHLAVDSTARDATVLGYRVVVAGDATATRALPDPSGSGVVDDLTVQRAALAVLADRFADVLPTEAIVRVPVTR